MTWDDRAGDQRARRKPAEASLAFYRDTLDFEVCLDVGWGKMRWITAGPPNQPGTSIVLHPPAADPGITDDERRIVAEMMAKGTYAIITLATADLDRPAVAAGAACPALTTGPGGACDAPRPSSSPLSNGLGGQRDTACRTGRSRESRRWPLRYS